MLKHNIRNESNNIPVDDIRETITKNIKPQKIGINVKGIRITKAKSICIQVGSKEDTEKLTEEINKLKQLKGKIEIKKFNQQEPQIILLNVPNYIKDNEIVNNIYEQNQQFKREYEKENKKVYKWKTTQWKEEFKTMLDTLFSLCLQN